ncbi:MAG: hypothetical protein ABMB14_35800, partial [Myxococcota bacterium]
MTPSLLFVAATARAVTFDALIADPVGTLLADPATAPGFRVVTLSNAAEACVNEHLAGTRDAASARACTRSLAAAATDPRLSRWDATSEDNLYATHLAIVLGAADRVDPAGCDEALHQAVALRLADRSLDHPDGMARSFASSPDRWPADQAATLYALSLYDHAHHATTHDAPLARFLAAIRRDRTPDGLIRSEWTGHTTNGEIPRGSAMTWTVRYLAAVAPDEAATLWTATCAALRVNLGIGVGFREFPVGRELPADIDSGPIVAGVGASATGFGIGASRAVGDLDPNRGLLRTERRGQWLASTDDGLATVRAR